MVKEVAPDDAGIVHFQHFCFVVRDEDFEIVAG
jgi:hypothetical protein